MTEIARSWLYFKLYPTSVDELDRAVVDVLGPLVERHRQQIVRWFFLRFYDGAGAHVRLRMLMSLADADAVAGDCDAIAGQLMSLPPGGSGRQRIGEIADGGPVPRDRNRPEVRLDVYEPELTKWGGQAYLPIAEAVFETSSRSALLLVPTLDGAVAGRVALGVLTMNSIFATLALGAAERQAFLETHYQWWSGAHGDSAHSRDRQLRAAADRMAGPVHRAVTELADSPAVRDAVDTFAVALRDALPASNPGQKPLFLVFHQLHLMLNRLGVAPYEEALVSLLTRCGTGLAGTQRTSLVDAVAAVDVLAGR